MGNYANKEVLALLNAGNDSNLTFSDVSFSELVALEGNRTGLKVSSVRGGRYTGELDIEYERLGLITLFKGFIPKLDVYTLEVDRTDLILGKIAERYGVAINPADATINTHLVEDNYYYEVVTDSLGLQFTESITFKATIYKSPIDIFVPPVGDRFIYPQSTANRTFSRVYSGGLKLPELGFELVKYQQGQFADQNLAWLTRIITGHGWVLEKDIEIAYNLGEAVVSYNGPIGSLELSPPLGDTLMIPPTGVDNVLVIELNDRLCNNMVGKLTYYY